MGFSWIASKSNQSKVSELIKHTFNREDSLNLACNEKRAFFEQTKIYNVCSRQKVCDARHYLLDNLFIRFGSKLYTHIVDIPVGTNCAPLIAELLYCCNE